MSGVDGSRIGAGQIIDTARGSLRGHRMLDRGAARVSYPSLEEALGNRLGNHGWRA
jgi:hypothetical protein